MRMVRKPSLVVGAVIRLELVEQQEGVEVPELRRSERALQTHTTSLLSLLSPDDTLDAPPHHATPHYLATCLH